MQPSTRHAHAHDASFEGGNLDCGNGLLLLIRKHLGPLRPGQFLEVRSLETSVEEDLPACLAVTHRNLNDRTIEGVRHRELQVASVQYHPEASAGPHDSSYLFDVFRQMMDGG